MNQKKEYIKNKIISELVFWYYYLTEFPKLRIYRYLNRNRYNEDNPLISVYCPTYNRAELLRDRAIKSVLSQSYENFEFIIIGDHCEDNTEEVIKNINDKRIRFFNLPYRKKRYPPTAENHWLAGPVVPANEALKRVKGKWIARIDDDDIWTKDHLESLLRYAQKHNLEFISASVKTIQYNKEIIIKAKDQSPPIGSTQTWLYKSYLRFFRYNINCWRKSWNRVNDYDLQDRMYRAGVKMGILDKIVTIVLPRPGDETIGSKAYLSKKDNICKHFKFEG